MTSNAYVWIWLPNEVEPVVAGKLQATNNLIQFNYGKSYLERQGNRTPAIPIYLPELPLKSGLLPLSEGLCMPSCIRDASPDAWGRRVILNQQLGLKGASSDTIELNEFTYLLQSGSDRIGALDFQQSPTEYIPRQSKNVLLEELQASALRVEQGIALSPELDQALFHGSSIGGARPKALIEDDHHKYVAKFSSANDLYSIVKAEYIAMKLAALAGIDTAPVRLTTSANKDVLLIERFDRYKTSAGWARKAMVSALTLLELDEMMARYASYETFAEIIRHRFAQPGDNLKELFSRLTFNILCGNTDDHARNYSAFWDGKALSLTPAYDICPQGRAGNTASQAMLITGNNNLSQLSNCRKSAYNFQLSEREAKDIFEQQIDCIKTHWTSVCDEARLSEVDRKLLMNRQFLNPFALS